MFKSTVKVWGIHNNPIQTNLLAQFLVTTNHERQHTICLCFLAFLFLSFYCDNILSVGLLC